MSRIGKKNPEIESKVLNHEGNRSLITLKKLIMVTLHLNYLYVELWVKRTSRDTSTWLKNKRETHICHGQFASLHKKGGCEFDSQLHWFSYMCVSEGGERILCWVLTCTTKNLNWCMTISPKIWTRAGSTFELVEPIRISLPRWGIKSTRPIIGL